MQDDARQAGLATELMESLTVEEPGFMPLVAVVDLVRSQVVQALERLLLTKDIQVENAEVVWRADRLYRASAADFADCLLERSAAAAGCSRTKTFDRAAVKNCAMTLVQ